MMYTTVMTDRHSSCIKWLQHPIVRKKYCLSIGTVLGSSNHYMVPHEVQTLVLLHKSVSKNQLVYHLVQHLK